MHPGIDVDFDPLCQGVIYHKDFKLGGLIEKSYGFSFVGPVSMEIRGILYTE